MLIRVKCTYNFLLIHASFVMSSHLSTIILYLFYAFCRTNLLTRCLVSVSCFCSFCISESPPQEISSDCAENLLRIFIRRKAPGDQRATWGPPTGQGLPAAAAPTGPTGGARSCPLGTLSAPSDAYKKIGRASCRERVYVLV